MYFAHRSSHIKYRIVSFFDAKLAGMQKERIFRECDDEDYNDDGVSFFCGETKANLAVDRYQFCVQLCSLFVIFMLTLFASD